MKQTPPLQLYCNLTKLPRTKIALHFMSIQCRLSQHLITISWRTLGSLIFLYCCIQYLNHLGGARVPGGNPRWIARQATIHKWHQIYIGETVCPISLAWWRSALFSTHKCYIVVIGLLHHTGYKDDAVINGLSISLYPPTSLYECSFHQWSVFYLYSYDRMTL